MSFSFLGKFGSAGSGNGEFLTAWGAVVDDSFIYVADRTNDRIQIFDKASPYGYVDQFGTTGSGNGEFNSSRNIDVDSNYIYVADQGNDRIQIFDKASPYAYVGQFGTTGSGNGEFNQAKDVKVDDSFIYVADRTNDRIQIFDKASPYGYVDQFGTTGGGDGEFEDVEGVAIDSNYIYATDAWFRVQIFNIASPYAHVATVGSPGSGDGEFNQPHGVAVDGSFIYVADAGNERVQLFIIDSPYTFVEKIEKPGGGAGSGDGEFDLPSGVVLSSGILYVVDSDNDRVQLFASAVPADPTNLTSTCSIPSPVSPTFTTTKDRETIDKVEGLLTVENGSATVTGFGTKFTEDLEIGSELVLNSVVYEVQSITNDTELVLTATYSGADASRIEAWIPVTVTFTNTTSIVGDATYFWDFGDGTFSTEENPIHTYTDGGAYEPTLKIYPMPAITGTISVEHGSATIEGSGTSFTTELVAGESMIINGVTYIIQSITDNDTLVLTTSYAGFSGSGIQAIKSSSKLTGTLSTTQDSVTVIGAGTSFSTEVVRGGVIIIEGVSYVVDEVVSDTELKLMNAYAATSDSGLDSFIKESRFEGAYESSLESQAVVISGKGPIALDYLQGGFEISLLELSSLSGDVSVTNGSAAVVGTGTSFTTELATLEQIVIEGVVYTLNSIPDDTNLILTAMYDGATDSGLSYYQKSVKLSGTVSVTNEEKNVIGSGTSFTTDYSIGDTITIVDVDYLVDDIVNNTELILSADYAGSTDTGLNYLKADSSYTNLGVGPFILNLIDTSLGEVTEYLWDFGNGTSTTKTGTLSVTQGSNLVTGSGTLFTSELAEGNTIEIGDLLYKVLNIISDTKLVLASYYAGEDASGLSYKLKGLGTTSTLANPEFYFDTAGTYEITLQVVKDSIVYTTTKTIQVKATEASPEEPLSSFSVSQGTGIELLTGSLGVKNGDTTVLGSGTSFTTELTAGGKISVEGVTYEIASIVNDEELVLTTAYQGGATASVALTGNLIVTNGSNLVTGTGTSFTTELIVNQTITLVGVEYTVLEIVSDTELEFTYAYAGTTDPSLSATKEEGILTQGTPGYSSFTGLLELTGTISVTQGNPKVTGVGTSFTTELVEHNELVIDGLAYTILGILSDTELILAKAYAGTTASNLITFMNSKSAPITEAIEFTNFTTPVEETLTGTLAVVNNSTTVLGSGTSFTTDLEEGQRLNIEGTLYTIGSITSDTELELTEDYLGATDSGLDQVAQLVETYFWDFGDGTFSTLENPTHIYTESGSFEAALTVTTKNGANTYYHTIESVAIDFYSIDIVNHRVGLYSLASTNTPKLIRVIGRFGNGRGQFNGLNDLIIVGKGKKTLQGMEV